MIILKGFEIGKIQACGFDLRYNVISLRILIKLDKGYAYMHADL